MAPSATQAAQAGTAATAEEHAATSILRDGTPVKLELLHKLDSKTAKNGDEIQFAVVNDVVVGGVTVLRRGSPVTGIVTQGEASKGFGRPGKLNFTVNDIGLGNGDKVPVRAFNRRGEDVSKGQIAGATAVAYAVGGVPLVLVFALSHGPDPTFPRGTEVTAFVNGDLTLNLSSFLGPPSAESAEDEFKTVLEINSTPRDAAVQIDGSAAGNTPLKLTLMGGRHEISIKKAGYSDWSQSVNLSGGISRIDTALQAVPSQ
jgi:hypothetical protein